MDELTVTFQILSDAHLFFAMFRSSNIDAMAGTDKEVLGIYYADSPKAVVEMRFLRTLFGNFGISSRPAFDIVLQRNGNRAM